MESVKLSCYSVWIENNQSTEEKEKAILNDLDGKDGRQILHDWINEVELVAINKEDDKKHLGVVRGSTNSQGREIATVFSYGKFGNRSNIKNVDNDQTAHTKDVREFEEMELGGCFYIPEDSKRGWMVLQKRGNEGLFSIIFNNAQRYFREQTGGKFKLMMAKAEAIDQVLSVLEQNKVSEIIVSRPGLPDGVGERILSSKLARRQSHHEVRLFPADALRRELIKNVKTAARQGKTGGLILGLDEGENTKFIVETPAGKRTLNMQNLEGFNLDYDITKTAWTHSAQIAGKPDMEVILRRARDMIGDHMNYDVQS